MIELDIWHRVSLYAQSRRTRIETAGQERDPPARRVASMLNPEEQGLKLKAAKTLEAAAAGLYAQSRRTRIETGGLDVIPLRPTKASMLNPEEQGLKPKVASQDARASRAASMLNPEEQGLKLTIF